MPALGPNAPYDSLATVTQMTRNVLGDFIEGIQPNLAGVVSTNLQNVTWVSGNQFSYLLNGVQIMINGAAYIVAQVTSATTLVLVGSAGVQANKAYAAVIPTGEIFADTQAYVVPIVNSAWRKFQKKLADKSHPRLKNKILISGIPVTTNLDPASEQYISWDAFFDGTSLQVAPILPPDFISPLKLTERQTGMAARFSLMKPAGDGLRPTYKTSWNGQYEWRDDAIYFPGSLLLMDMLVEYSAFLPDLVVGTGSTFASVQVPIMRCADALAYYCAELFVTPRGGEALAPGYALKGDAATDQITNSAAKFQQRESFHRRAWGERGRRGSNRYGL